MRKGPLCIVEPPLARQSVVDSERPTAVVRSSLKPSFNGENADVENGDAWR